ncbi:filamentous hemagglutinin N-terminal domain-containing protein [Nostocales cyanobacterium LEGE 12452]|nr:filamentous hemagglutinin N-terminal domain-containing protein [Nostocales cyanobacterium LEGE 12452]
MLKSWLAQGCQLILLSLLILSGLLYGEGGDIYDGLCLRTLAQITADPSLGTKAESTDGRTYQIEGGTNVGGTNLFHSFNRFDVPDGGSANFLNDPNIVNIFSRVTGGNQSVIQGLISAQGNANLFLINPSGLIFRGENAKLNIGGSFIGTTASAIQFPGGGEFSMTSPINQLDPLLKVNPSALLFNQIASEPIKPIQVNDASLSVPDSQSLLLLGGDVNLQGGELKATSGRVELGGLAGAGTVGLDIDNNNFRLIFPNGVALADVSLSDRATVTAPDSEGGIQVQGRRVQLTDNSKISIINTFGGEPGGTLAVTASESLELLGGSILFTDTEESGNAGELKIETGQLIVQDGAQVSASTRSQGQGGKLSVIARDSIQLIGSSRQRGGLFTVTLGTGNAGELNIETGQMIVQDGGEVTVSSRGTGNAGLLTVNANSITLDTQGKLTGTTASGRGGDISLYVRDLILIRNRSAIATTAANNGNGGNIRIDAPFIIAVPGEDSDILANANQGTGGRIEINATGIYGLENRTKLPPNLKISEINASSDFGLNGTVEVNTPDVNPTRGLINLPTQPVDTEIAQACQPDTAQNQSSFIITGRGGLPPNPRTDPLSSDAVQVDWVALKPMAENHAITNVSTQTASPTPAPIVEAQGWVRNDKGEVVLTADASTATPQSSWQTPPNCRSDF